MEALIVAICQFFGFFILWFILKFIVLGSYFFGKAIIEEHKENQKPQEPQYVLRPQKKEIKPYNEQDYMPKELKS